MTDNNWFEDWFDSPYYHILYKNRDRAEAEEFISNITSFLACESQSKMLDLACGMGRHAIYLNSLGFNVLGADLSPSNIVEAQKFSNPRLQFIVHDMRLPIENETFNYIFNLFTSFGYFYSENENLQMLQSVTKMLPVGGCFILDFFNTQVVINQLKALDIKTIDGIEFTIKKEVKGNFIYKHIEFKDLGKDFAFTERVQALTAKQIESLMLQCGLEPIHTFGDYLLKPFVESTSPRLIIVAKKKLS